MASTYAAPPPQNHMTFFMDCEIAPDSLASGQLLSRLDTRMFPQLGVIGDPVIGAASITVSINPAHPAHTDDVKITVTVASGVSDIEPSSTVDILKNGSVLHAGLPLAQGVGTYDAGLLTAGTYTITAKYPGDDHIPPLTSQAYTLTVT